MRMKRPSGAQKPAHSLRRIKHSVLMYLVLLFASAFLLLVLAYLQEVAYAQASAELFHVEHSIASTMLTL